MATRWTRPCIASQSINCTNSYFLNYTQTDSRQEPQFNTINQNRFPQLNLHQITQPYFFNPLTYSSIFSRALWSRSGRIIFQNRARCVSLTRFSITVALSRQPCMEDQESIVGYQIALKSDRRRPPTRSRTGVTELRRYSIRAL